MLAIRLAFASIVRNPARTILTAFAMIAAASVVSWMVAGYDAMLSSFDNDAEKVIGRFDLMLFSSAETRGVEPFLLDNIAYDPEYRPDLSCFYVTNVTVRKSGASAPGKVNTVSEKKASSSATVTPRDASHKTGENAEIPSPRGGGRGGGMMGGSEATPALYGLPYRDPRIVGTDSTQPPLELKSGAWLTSGLSPRKKGSQPIEVVADEAAAKNMRLSVGSPINIGSNAGVFPGRVIGIIEENPSGRKYASMTDDTLRTPSSNILYVSKRDAERIAGGALPVAYASIRLKNRDQLAEFQKKWTKTAFENKAFLAGMPEIEAALSSKLDDSRAKMQAYSATAISLLVSFFIIFTTLSMGIDERIRQFALLRTVGLKRSQTASIVLVEAVFLGLIGWGGGLLSGEILFAILEKYKPDMLNADLRIGGWTVLLTGVCALAGALAASILPVWRVTRIRPLEAMQIRTASESHPLKRWPILCGILMLVLNPLIVTLPGIGESLRVKLYGFLGCPAAVLGFVLLAPVVTLVCIRLFSGIVARIFGLRNAFLDAQLRANLWRCAGTIISLSIGLGFYMMILIWSASMLIPFIPGKWMPDLFVAVIPGGMNPENARLVSEIDGIAPNRCLPVAIEQVKLAEDITKSRGRQNVVRQDNVVLLGVDVSAGYAASDPLLNFHYLSGNPPDIFRKLQSGNNYCVIPQHFAEVTGLKVDDTFEVVPPDSPDSRIRYTVAGIIELKGWHWFSKFSGSRRNTGRTAAMVFGSYENIARNFNLKRVNFFWMDLLPGAQLPEIEKQIREIAGRGRGETYHIPGSGDSKVNREYVRPTSTAQLHDSIQGRTNMMVDGMLKMPLLILLVTSLAVANTALASIRARKWEIGVMRACGLSGWALMRLVLAEALMIGITALVLSLGYGFLSGICSAQMSTHLSFFGGMGWNFAVPYLNIAKGVGITMTICLIAAFIPAVIAGCTKPLVLLQDGRDSL